MMRRNLALLVAVGLVFGLGACGGGGGGSVASFCNLVKKDSKSFSPSSKTSAVSELKKIESSAPSAIKGDIKTLTDYLDSVSSSKPQVPSASEIAKLTAAEKNITAYTKDKCNIDLTSTT